MQTLQNLITPFSNAWYGANSHELVSFGVFFAALWLIALVVEAAINKATKKD